ncbi:MAG: hypothetical protein AB7G13_22350 [Lautropia sp.]
MTVTPFYSIGTSWRAAEAEDQARWTRATVRVALAVALAAAGFAIGRLAA